MNKLQISKVMRLAVVLCNDGTTGIILTPEELRRESREIAIELPGGGMTARSLEEEVEVLASPYTLALNFLADWEEKSKQKGGEINNGKETSL